MTDRERGQRVSDHGRPAAAVLDDLCQACGGDLTDQHEGHKYQAFPRPQLPVGVDVLFEQATFLEDASLRARVRGEVRWPTGPDVGASVWLWSTSTDGEVPDCEWDVLRQAVRVQLYGVICTQVFLDGPRLHYLTSEGRWITMQPKEWSR